MKVSQNDENRMWTSFTSVFLMHGTELRSFCHLEILDKNRLILTFGFIHCKTLKVSKKDQIEL